LHARGRIVQDAAKIDSPHARPRNKLTRMKPRHEHPPGTPGQAFTAARIIFTLATAIAVMFSGCGREAAPSDQPTTGEKKLTAGVSLMNLSSEFIVMLNQALDAKAKALDVKLIVNDAQRSPERQVQQVESFIAQRVDAIILNPCEVEASSPAVDKARAAGIPIVNVNSETKSAPTAFVGSRDAESARLAMEYIAQRLNGQGNVVMMHGYMGQAAQIKRDQGAREVLAKHPGLKLLADQTAEWDRAKAMALMENWIQSYGAKINAVFAQNDEMGMGALIALEQAKLKDKVIVASVDAIADALQAVKDGRLDATVFQDAAGQAGTALEIAVKIVRKQPYEPEVFIPFRLVTRNTK
jgi:inositol transport system substrate-binding protein